MATSRPSKKRKTSQGKVEVGWVNVTAKERFVALDADGDCFYRAVANCFSGSFNIQVLRDLVADNLKIEHFEALQVAFKFNNREYAYMRQCKTLNELAAKMRLSGALLSSRQCVWADWLQIQLLATLLGLVVLIRDSSASYNMTIWPEEQSPVFCAGHGAPCHPRVVMYMHVVRVESCHYNLFYKGDTCLFSHAEILETSVVSDFPELTPRTERKVKGEE